MARPSRHQEQGLARFRCPCVLAEQAQKGEGKAQRRVEKKNGLMMVTLMMAIPPQLKISNPYVFFFCKHTPQLLCLVPVLCQGQARQGTRHDSGPPPPPARSHRPADRPPGRVAHRQAHTLDRGGGGSQESKPSKRTSGCCSLRGTAGPLSNKQNFRKT